MPSGHFKNVPSRHSAELAQCRAWRGPGAGLEGLLCQTHQPRITRTRKLLRTAGMPLQDRSRGAGALRNSHWTKDLLPAIYRRSRVTAGQLALALTPYAQVTDLAVNTAASGNNAAAIQSLSLQSWSQSWTAARWRRQLRPWPRRRPWPPRTDRWPRTEAASPRCRAC